MTASGVSSSSPASSSSLREPGPAAADQFHAGVQGGKPVGIDVGRRDAAAQCGSKRRRGMRSARGAEGRRQQRGQPQIRGHRTGHAQRKLIALDRMADLRPARRTVRPAQLLGPRFLEGQHHRRAHDRRGGENLLRQIHAQIQAVGGPGQIDPARAYAVDHFHGAGILETDADPGRGLHLRLEEREIPEFGTSQQRQLRNAGSRIPWMSSASGREQA
jgi:hypothetical protein